MFQHVTTKKTDTRAYNTTEIHQSDCDMGRMPGVFARVTLVYVQGAALMLAVDVGLVELCCVVGSCVGFFVVTC